MSFLKSMILILSVPAAFAATVWWLDYNRLHPNDCVLINGSIHRVWLVEKGYITTLTKTLSDGTEKFYPEIFLHNGAIKKVTCP